MKQIVLLIYIVLTIFIIQCTSLVIPSNGMSSLHNDILIDGLAGISNVSRTDIVDCFDQGNIEPITLVNYIKSTYDDNNKLDEYITNTEETRLKIGCWSACFTQKYLPDVHADRYLDYIESEFTANRFVINFLTSDTTNQVLDCFKKIQTRNECEMHYEVLLCLKPAVEQFSMMLKNYHERI